MLFLHTGGQAILADEALRTGLVGYVVEDGQAILAAMRDTEAMAGNGASALGIQISALLAPAGS